MRRKDGPAGPSPRVTAVDGTSADLKIDPGNCYRIGTPFNPLPVSSYTDAGSKAAFKGYDGTSVLWTAGDAPAFRPVGPSGTWEFCDRRTCAGGMVEGRRCGLGYRHIDTAEMYGNETRGSGKGLARVPAIKPQTTSSSPPRYGSIILRLPTWSTPPRKSLARLAPLARRSLADPLALGPAYSAG